MEIKNYSKKRLYSILRSSLIGLKNVSVFSYLLDIYHNKDDIEYNKILLKVFDISEQEFNDFISFESYPRDYISSKPSFFTLNRSDMCNLIKNLIIKLHDEKYIDEIKNDMEQFKKHHPLDKYFSSSFILNLFELRASEYNEIINYEETLALQGTKDNGLSELNYETKEMIKSFLIKLNG